MADGGGSVGFPDAAGLVREANGARVKEPRLGVGSFLTFVLGEDPRDHPGQGWYVWAYQCAWRLDAGDRTVCGSDDERAKINDAVAGLDGAQLLTFDIDRACEATLKFSGDLELRFFPVRSTEYIHWMLWLPDGYVLSAGPGWVWTREPAAAPTS
jgi:hypothetical protein